MRLGRERAESCLDGAATIEEVAVDLAEGLGTDYDTILSDLLPLMGSFLLWGLVSDATTDQQHAVPREVTPPSIPSDDRWMTSDRVASGSDRS